MAPTSLTHRIVAWLCLALVLLTGSTPAQGFVLCIERDGCVTIEVKPANAACGGCDEHEQDRSSSEATTSTSAGAPCECIDLVVPGFHEQQLVSGRPIEVHVGPWITPSTGIHVPPISRPSTPSRGPPRCVPRVADAWAHIRSVVLLV